MQHVGEVDGTVELLADQGAEPQRAQRVAAEVEEVVVLVDLVDAEDLHPELLELGDPVLLGPRVHHRCLSFAVAGISR